MNALQLSVNSQQLTGEQLANLLDKDFASMKKTYDRHREKDSSLPPLSKIEIVSEKTSEYLTALYSHPSGVGGKGQNITDKQTPIRKIETPQYEPPFDKAKFEEELKTQFDSEKKRIKEENEKRLQRERQRIEQETRQALQSDIAKAVEAERQRLKEQYAEKLAFTDEKVQLNVESVRAKVELQLRDELDNTLLERSERTKRELDRAHQQRMDELQRQYETEIEAEKQKLISVHAAEVEAQKRLPFFEKKLFAVAVLLITMSVQMYEVGLFIQQTFHFTDLYLSLFWAGAFQFGGLMMTIHIGNHPKFWNSFLFWFASLSVVIDLFVLLPESTGAWNTPARILFAVMFPLIEFAYGKIYLKLK